MKTTDLKSIMQLAWQFVKRNGYTLSEALTIAWANFKLKAKMKKGIVRFYYQKVDGSRREAFGTIYDKLIPDTVTTDRKRNDTVQVYFDTERQSWRSFKKANLSIL